MYTNTNVDEFLQARGFDFKNNGDFKIKDHPEIFIDPLTASDSEINSSDEYSSPDSAVLKKRKM